MSCLFCVYETGCVSIILCLTGLDHLEKQLAFNGGDRLVKLDIWYVTFRVVESELKPQINNKGLFERASSDNELHTA